jgi:hypothetical protein
MTIWPGQRPTRPSEEGKMGKKKSERKSNNNHCRPYVGIYGEMGGTQIFWMR